MAYTPITTITNTAGVLTESNDLTILLSDFANKESYLVVEENHAKYVLDISDILLFERDLVLSQPMSAVFTSRLSDSFVTRYLRTDIPILNDYGTYDNRIKVFNPLEYKNHTVQFTSINTPTIIDDITRKGYLDDLVINTRYDISNYLVAVNGVFHKTAIHNGKLYVLDGFRTIRISEFKDITIVDTGPIGGHTVIPLTSLNVSLTTYNGRATITSPTSLKNKTVFLVVDGYFYHLESDVMKLADDTHLKVDVNKLTLIDQFRHNPRTLYRKDRLADESSQKSRKYDDAYDALFLGKRSIPIASLQTRDFQYSRLTGYHSFLVMVNNPHIFSISSDVMSTGTPQFYRDHVDRVLSGMMQFGVGSCPSYVILKDPHKRKSIYIQNQNYDVNIHHDTINPPFLPTIIPDLKTSLKNPPRLIDYVSA